MAWNGQPPQGPWDFFHTTPNQGGPGIGIDHTTGPTFPQGFPFGGPGGFNPWAHRGGGWGWGGPPGRHDWAGRHAGRHARRHHRRGGGDEEPPYTDGEQQQEDTAMLSENEKAAGEKGDSPDTMRAASGEHPDPPESVPQGPQFHRHRHEFRGRGRCGGRGGGGMRGHHHHGPPPHFGGGGAFPWGMMSSFAQSPFGQGLREYLDRAAQGEGNNAANNNNNENVEEDVEFFQPPVDVFRSANGWILHIAVPGAKKEDVGVNWDADKGTLSVSGVVYRPGDEEFLKGLVSGERKVGLFKREVKLPPAGEEKGEKGEKDEVDGEGIKARMEDGILVVMVPVVEREWTEVRKVDIL